MASAPAAAASASAFGDAALERLYQSHSVRGRRAGLAVFVCAALLYDAYALAASAGALLVLSGVLLALNGVLLALVVLPWPAPHPRLARCLDAVWAAAPHLAWQLANVQLMGHLFLKQGEVTPRDALGWALLLDFLLFVTLPLRLRWCCVLSLATCACFLIAVAGLGLGLGLAAPPAKALLAYQLGASLVLLVATNLLGLLAFCVADRQQRSAFLQTRQSLQMKLVIEEQSSEQERLLLSVLPEHVAVRMRQDLGCAKDGQFKKIYMSRHENVSILYADIVGFTAISSTYSASELVKILNELFARFDRLSERYQQLRIKILGDCYYCISGAPVERPDHAVLCVHMGLSMVKAIKYVQETTKANVDMRVGIHTGAVLAGVLGQRQWQFDVYSKDVELANKMESSGLPGRVHISERTLGFLDGAFEVEPALGERREEALRLAGIRTFFIVRALKPFQPELSNGSLCKAAEAGEETDFAEKDSKCGSAEAVGAEDEAAEEAEAEGKEVGEGEESAFTRRLRRELGARDGRRELRKHAGALALAFADGAKEQAYQRHRDALSSAPLLGCPLAHLLAGAARLLVLPRDVVSAVSLGVGELLLLLLSLMCVAEFIPGKLLRPLRAASAAVNGRLALRRTVAGACVLLLGATNLALTASCAHSPAPLANCSLPSAGGLVAEPWAGSAPGAACLYPSFVPLCGVVLLAAGALPMQLGHLAKAGLLLALAVAHCVANVWALAPALACEQAAALSNWPQSAPPVAASLCALLAAATLALALYARYSEEALRVLFLWRAEAEEQRERAADIRRRNEALVYNILPPHVAKHFLGHRTRQHEELYSQSYAEVGVLFASMPNFSDFYSEETVNNQGLECLRFLNEVISDFDALLEEPKFQDIIKIKTIGSTYMAASGLNPSRQFKPEEPVEVRWAHLALLVEFALELKRALQGINEQSFNHFVLKMGINHGPITAGVIGARKPHYDIWGNSVNVASRMESTGKAGCIQVTDETTAILRHFGYTFEQRGLVSVKGKGQLMTYYLIGKEGGGDAPAPASARSPAPV